MVEGLNQLLSGVQGAIGFADASVLWFCHLNPCSRL